VHVLAEVLVGHVAAAVAEQHPTARQQALQVQLVEGGQHHPLGQIAGGAEQDEDRGRQVVCVLPLGWHVCQPM